MAIDPLDVTQFRYRPNNEHNRNMLEYQAEKLFARGMWDHAAQFAIAAALLSVVVAIDAKGEG